MHKDMRQTIPAEHNILPSGRRLLNQRGAALIVAISLLAIMSILGTILISSTTTEISLTSNTRNHIRAFNTADRAIEYAMQRATLTTAATDLYVDADAGGTLHRDYIDLGNAVLEPVVGENTVEFVGSGPPPPGFASDAGEFKANFHLIKVVAIAPDTATYPSRVTIKSQIAKIVPK